MSLFRTTALALILTSASPAFADVTPAQVWDKLQELINTDETVALTIGSIEETSDRIAVSNLAIQSEEDGISVSASSPSLVLQDRGDGTVELQYAETSPILISSTAEGDEFEIKMDLIQSNVSYIVSGEPELMNFALAGEKIELKLVGLEAPNETLTATGSLIMTGLTGNSVYAGGDDLDYSGDFAANQLTMDFNIQDTDDGSGGTIKTESNNIRFDLKMVLPDGTSDEDMFVKEGMFRMTSGVDSTAAAIDLNTPDGPFNLEFVAQGSTSDIGLGPDGMIYDSSLSGLNIRALMPDMLPFPIEASLGKFAMLFKTPIAPGDSGDMNIGLTIADLSVSDGLWNLFDPGQMLSRDPATLDIQLSGVGEWSINIMDEEALIESDGDEIPGKIESFSIDRLELDAVGATASGGGSFVFDNNDLTTFPGFPRPEGKVSLSVTGLNALIDTMIQMGFMAEDEAMGMRMGMAMFSNPGPTPDSMSTELEVTPQGQVIVNGQRIR